METVPLLRKTIVHIEPDVFLAEMYGVHLTRAGFSVYTINDADGDIVSRVFEKHPDLILLSVWIDNREWWELLRLFKADTRTQNIPIFMLTNQGQRKDVNKSIVLGATDHLCMWDFPPSQVARCVHQYLENPKTYAPVYPKYLKARLFKTLAWIAGALLLFTLLASHALPLLTD